MYRKSAKFFYPICNFRRIRDHLDLNSAKLLANALVSSRLDYCNSLLYGINEGLSKKLQTVQNSLARVVVPSVKRTDHISPVLSFFGCTNFTSWQIHIVYFSFNEDFQEGRGGMQGIKTLIARDIMQ